MKATEKSMDKIVALCKNRGFVFAGSEIYGGLANTWDYGPLGVELKNNVKKAWWKKFVQESPYNVGLDAAILMNPQTWVASGHLAGFSDPLMDCRECHERFRADKLIEDWSGEKGVALPKPVDAFTQAEMKSFIEENSIPAVQPDVQNFPRCNRGRQEHGVSPSRNGPGHFCELCECTALHEKEASLRHRADRKIFPE